MFSFQVLFTAIVWRTIFTPWLRRAAAENARVAKLLNELPGEVNVDRLVAEATSTKVVKEHLQPVGPQAVGPKDPPSAPVSAMRRRVSSLAAKRMGERRSGDGGRRSTLDEATRTTPGRGDGPPPATKKPVVGKLRMGTV